MKLKIEDVHDSRGVLKVEKDGGKMEGLIG